ncbi:unnamed protein product [Schistosoma margrebowiei]|uniref:DUF4203 domain-containing protein n=1 Tax=Schistosoma margrebowiei TaxID=48269 RepID=A0AA85AN44_9TREM|nr:unnamed protein product [Schistosoma margrebowiei]
MEFASNNVSNETCHEYSTCIFHCYTEAVVLSGFILTLIGLVLGLIIIFIRELHSTSTMNTIFIAITMIFINVGVALLMSFAKWYEQIISVTVATAFVIIAILVDVEIQGSKGIWELVLFTLCLVFVAIGFLFFIFGAIFNIKGLLVATLFCWCGEMIIVITCTKYYLDIFSKREHFSLLYCVFLLVSSQWFHINIDRISSWIINNIHKNTAYYIHSELYLHRDNHDRHKCRCCITNVICKVVRTNYFCNCGYRARHHSHFIGCKATWLRKEMDDTLVCDWRRICVNWIHSHYFVGDIKKQWSTICNFGLLVLRNFHCKS